MVRIVAPLQLVYTYTACSDVTMKEFIMNLEEKRKIYGGAKFIIQDLGSEGLFLKRDALAEIQV